MNISVEIENFKSIISTKINLKEGLNILIGPNGAGKTCLLSSLKFLRDTMFKGVGIAMAKGGGQKRIYNRGKKYLSFNIHFDYGRRVVKNRRRDVFCKWEIRIEQKGTENNAVIAFEKIYIYSKHDKELELFSLELNRANIAKPKLKYFINTDNIGKDLFSNFAKENYADSKLEIYRRFEEKIKQVKSDLRSSNDRSLFMFFSYDDRRFSDLISLFSTLNEYNIIPERARQATEQVPFAAMASSGYGISEVIDALTKRNFHRITSANAIELESDYMNRYYSRLYYNQIYPSFGLSRKNLSIALENINRELASAVRPINSVDVKIDDTTGKRFVVFKTSKELFFPDEVSDGTIKWLCILASIYVGFSNIYLLEEPENFLHPWMQQKLVEIMRDHAKTNKTVFLMTTHSTTLLNSCLPDEILLVKQKKHGTDVHAIENQNEIKEFLNDSDFRLGDLWVSGGIGATPE